MHSHYDCLPEFSFFEFLCVFLCSSLQCGVQLCGRLKNKHALAHNEKPHSDEHNLALNTSYFMVWCYKCDMAVAPTQTKKLQACVDMVKKERTKLNTANHLAAEEEKNSLNASTSTPDEPNVAEMLPKTINNSSGYQENAAAAKLKLDLDGLPRVRGLSNLGNTCFFNAVLQCLSQTPFLVEILKQSKESGETFTLPGGYLKLENGEELYLQTINGILSGWGNLTAILAETLEQVQSATPGGGGGVFSPKGLLKQLSLKWPQFGNGDQQDSHELLRHLLESVRCEDLRRYQSIILKLLGYSSKVDPSQVEDSVKQKIKFYGNQVNLRILRPEQVFRGFLVSTLTCQDCFNTSSRHESFLDISLPILTEKPHPPMRRKSSPDPPEISRSAAKKEKERKRRAKRLAKKQGGSVAAAAAEGSGPPKNPEDSSSGDQTDGDVEDNEDDSTATGNKTRKSLDDNGNNAAAAGAAAATGEKTEISNEIVELGIKAPSEKLLQMAKTNALAEQLEATSLAEMEAKRRQRRQRTYSAANWSTTLAPKYQCEVDECSVQSCLNNFTWIELMTGNNKVSTLFRIKKCKII